MKLATWNVESIRAHEAQVLTWVDHHRPTVLCLQETRVGTAKFPRQGLAERGYELIVHGGDDGHGGVALASLVDLDDVVVGIPGAVAPLDEPRSIAATIGFGGEPLRIHTCYAPNGRKVRTRPHAVKLAWLALLEQWLAIDRADYRQQILAGDLNIAPQDCDVWNPGHYRKRNLTSPPERAAFAALLADDALVDTVRAFAGDDRSIFTWWNRRGDFYKTDRGWRLDHVLATPPVAAAVVDVMVDRAERGRAGSADHAPILVTLGVADGQVNPG